MLPRKIARLAKSFYDELAQLCVGGARLFVADANMAFFLFGIFPDMAQRDVELHLRCIHAEYNNPPSEWKSETLGIWAVGPILDPGQAVSIETHTLTALYHPRLTDVPAKYFLRGFPVVSNKFRNPGEHTNNYHHTFTKGLGA